MKRATSVLLLLLVSFSSLVFPAVASAASSPDTAVIVAREETASTHCRMKRVTAVGTPDEATMVMPCPAGTIVSTFIVSKLEAQTQHESYVSFRQAPGSASEQDLARNQIHALIQSVRQAAKRAANSNVQVGTATPLVNTPCGQTNALYTWWNPSWDGSTEFESYVSWLHTVDCKYVYIQQSSIWEYEHHTTGYFIKALYAGDGWQFLQGCNQITSSPHLNLYPDTNETPGYDMVQYTTSGSNCFPWDPVSTVAQGPLN